MKPRRRRTTCSMPRMWKRAETNTKHCGRSDRATQSSALMSLRVCETFFLQRTLLLTVVFMDNTSCCLSNSTSSKSLEHTSAYYKQPNRETSLIHNTKLQKMWYFLFILNKHGHMELLFDVALLDDLVWCMILVCLERNVSSQFLVFKLSPFSFLSVTFPYSFWHK